MRLNQPTLKLLSKHLYGYYSLFILLFFYFTGFTQIPNYTVDASAISKYEMLQMPYVVFASKDFDLQKNYPTISESFKPFKVVNIPSRKVTSKVIIKFQIVNKSDEQTACYFFPGFFFSNVNLYKVEKDNQLTPIPSIAPNHKDSVSFRLISLPAFDSMTVVAECYQIKTYVNLIKPRFIEENHIDAFIIELQSYKKGEGLFTYVFCGLLIMMVFFSLANYMLGKSREFLYYAAYAFSMCFMFFTKQYYYHRSNLSSFFYEEFLDFILQGSGIAFFMAFMMHFLNTRKNYPSLNKLYQFGISFILMSLITYSYLHYGTDNYFIEELIENYITKVVLLLMVVIFLVYAIKRWEDKLLRYLFIGHLLFFIFSLASLTLVLIPDFPRLPGILGSSLVLYEIGLLLELIFFLIALTYKTRITLIEKIMESERLKLKNERNELDKRKAVIEAHQEERERISADMHDELGSGMTTIRLMSEIAKNKMKGNVPVEIEKISASANDLLNKMNAIIWSMNSSNDTADNLISYFRAYATEYFDGTPIQCNIYIPVIIHHKEISGDKRRNIFLALKETLNNALKHSQATEMNINISVDEKLLIKIWDNGIGLDPEKTNQFGNGLRNIKRRMKTIGGSFTISNKDGTEIILELPL